MPEDFLPTLFQTLAQVGYTRCAHTARVSQLTASLGCADCGAVKAGAKGAQWVGGSLDFNRAPLRVR